MGKKNTVYWNPRHWIQLKTTASFFCPPLFFVIQIQCPFPCVSYQALLLNSLFTISIFISCCLWSEVCMILAFLPHPFAYFQLFVPNSRQLKFFSVSIKGSSYRESTVVSNDQNPLLASTPRGIKQKKFIFNPWINLHVISAYHEQ